MKTLELFSIPIEGLRLGSHKYEFSVDDTFFSCFEGSPIKKGKFEVHIDLEKRSDIYELDFDIRGYIETQCDRCLADIHLPSKSEERLILKYSSEQDEVEDVIYIKRDAHHYNIAQQIYEYICLGKPLTNIYDCRIDEPYPCNETVLSKLGQSDQVEEKKVENPIWDQLNKLDFNN
jgi:uncharacterized metal-binding protein YceD (DUF177 family)